MFRFRDGQVFVFVTISWFTEALTSRWVSVHETRCIFEYIFWTSTNKLTKLDQLIDINKGGFTLKRVGDMTKTYSCMHRTDKYSQHSWIILPVRLNGWVFVYELSSCGFESSCSHLIFWTVWRTGASFQVLSHLGSCPNYPITNYVKIPVFHFFETVNKVQLKMVNANL